MLSFSLAPCGCSGGHLNPVVSLVFFLLDMSSFPLSHLLGYLAAQFMGAIAGAACLKVGEPTRGAAAHGCPLNAGPHYSSARASTPRTC
jgi:glycerol uptake facilitator-like aquaporin